MPSAPTTVLVALVLSAILVNWVRRGRYKYPPGPKPLPIVGNINDIPAERPWVTFKQWSSDYNSDIVSISAFGKTTCIINSWQAAQDVFVKRSAIYSSRPRMPMVIEVLSLQWSFAFMSNNLSWKEHRRMFRKEIGVTETDLYYPHALRSARALTKSLMETPEKYRAHARHMAASMVLGATYGLHVKQNNDPFVEIAERAMLGLGTAGTPGAYIVDLIPALQYLPGVQFLPGFLGKWKRQGLEWSKWIRALLEAPFAQAKKNFEEGSSTLCIVSRVLERISHLDEAERQHQELVLKQVTGVIYGAGSDTMVSSLLTFIVAMLLYPDVQKKAQAAVDRVIGKDRLPTYDDFDSLPYVHAIIKEVLRWQPVTPLAVAHSAGEDGFYGDYFIPKGAVILGNAWAMLRDESIFGPKTDEFIPERFLRERQATSGSSDDLQGDMELDPSVPHPDMAFGFGRRLCPGRHLAYSTLWISVAHLLQTFDLLRAKDENGEEILPSLNYRAGIVSTPKEFACTFRVRNPHGADLIQEQQETD